MLLRVKQQAGQCAASQQAGMPHWGFNKLIRPQLHCAAVSQEDTEQEKLVCNISMEVRLKVSLLL